ncbi:MAG: DUF2490 domain-containing protein [Terrimonas sp.]|nr:DUF2490 domain-containing protein [Terrimonas sp.]
MHVKKIPVLLVFCLVAAIPLSAQTQHSVWLASFQTYRLDQRFSIHFDGQWRSTDHLQSMQTLLLRSGLNFRTGRHLVVSAGYAFISNRKSIAGITGYAPEHRIWEQAIVSHTLKKINTTHRFRLEQRMISNHVVRNNELAKTGTHFTTRFRYFIRNTLPFTQKEIFHKGIFAAIQNEIFLNNGNRSFVNGKTFDQNRFYLAVGYKFNPSLSMDFGYLNQYINGKNSSSTNNHILQLATYTQL